MNNLIPFYNVQCCLCSGYCAHTGSHSYCSLHSPLQTRTSDNPGPLPVFNEPKNPLLGHISLIAQPASDPQVIALLTELIQLNKRMVEELKEIRFNSNKL